jgi:hypothetical protein
MSYELAKKYKRPLTGIAYAFTSGSHLRLNKPAIVKLGFLDSDWCLLYFDSQNKKFKLIETDENHPDKRRVYVDKRDRLRGAAISYNAYYHKMEIGYYILNKDEEFEFAGYSLRTIVESNEELKEGR